MKSKEKVIDNICSLIILNILSKQQVNTRIFFRNIFLNGLGIITDESYLIRELEKQQFITHEGFFENSNFYKSLMITKKGQEHYNEEMKCIEIPKGEFLEKREEMLKKYLGID